jgi:GTP cyclohydrolase II
VYARKFHDPPLVEPTWEQIHEDLENGRVIGTYGNCHSAYHGLAALRAGVDLHAIHGQRSPDEYYSPELSEHMENPKTRAQWHKIFTLDPLGMYAKIPTMSWTTACISFPEIKDQLVVDGKIVDARDKSINVTKVAVDYVWNLPRFSEGCGLDLKQVREALKLHTQNEHCLDEKRNAYLPPVGGCTIYIIGDVRKIHDPEAEICVRVHDQCTGSDCLGTDICTCRPYLVYAAQAAAECAQRGGVGLLVYYQKEGRSLGEVTKFRVYNARRAQEGGDRPEMYFHQTEAIAGIRDARFQEMMPDPLLWLGVSRIDWLLSMSSEKYEAITSTGIRVLQRVALPDSFVPKNAGVEINAKVASGYHSDSLNKEGIISHLRNLEMVRERCGQIFQMAVDGKTHHFSVDMTRLDFAATYVVNVIQTQYPTLDVPLHSRWRHFAVEDIKAMSQNWPADPLEQARRKIDLVTISVLLDAGAGSNWSYHSHKGGLLSRSEGLALASLDMFKDGFFSSDVAVPHRVNAHGLEALDLKTLQRGFQVTESNELVGLEGRHDLLKSLAAALRAGSKYFGTEVQRPGNLVDFVMPFVVDGKVSIKVLWECIVVGLEPVWPAKGTARGDVWVYSDMKKIGVNCSDYVPFHKLSQWLTYSMIEVFSGLGVTFTDTHLLTALAEYRNGGLMIDTGLLVPKDPIILTKRFDTGSEIIVEWRALTVCLVDRIADAVRQKLGKTAEEMPLGSILEGGTWQAGRNIAREKREDGSPPITVVLSGDVF